jgi:hypothetical protein
MSEDVPVYLKNGDLVKANGNNQSLNPLNVP